MEEREKVRFYSIVVRGLMRAKLDKLKEQVERGEISGEWLRGYIRGVEEYDKELLNCEITIF
jgi:hypothetical protein